MKKSKISLFAALTLVASMLMSTMSVFAETPEVAKVDSYADVGENHWAYPWVTFMTNEGYIHGYPAAENEGLEVYKPDQNITRAEFVTILYFMLNPSADMTESFTDVSVDDWFYNYVSKAVGTGYMSGYGDGTAGPNKYITREEASSIVYRAFKIDKYVNETHFADEDEISAWAYEAIMSLAELGVVVGYTGEEDSLAMIQPKVNIKRAEVASLLANADKFYPTSVILSDAATVSYKDGEGAEASIVAKPKNTSDELNVAVDVEPETNMQIVYIIAGDEKTVTPEELTNTEFTAEQVRDANFKFVFPDAKPGDKYTVTVTVTDNAIEGEDKVVGQKVYETVIPEEITDPVTPTPTPTPTPSGGSITGGSSGPSVPRYTVTYKDQNDNVIGTETVYEGNKIAKAPARGGDEEGTGDYKWYTDKACTTEFDMTTAITEAKTLYTNIVYRDRVVEALKAYQAMKGKTGATEVGEKIAADVDGLKNGKAYDKTTNKWWTKDMLSIIVANDLNKLNDGAFDDIVDESKEAAKIYDDVARYVVDNSTVLNFAGVTVDSTTKLEYVKFFRAMVKTIDSALVTAVNEYKAAREAGNVTKDEAYDKFIAGAAEGATSGLANAITAEALTLTNEQKTEIITLAVAYVTQIKDNAGGLDSIKTDLAAITDLNTLTPDKAAEMIASKRIYK